MVEEETVASSAMLFWLCLPRFYDTMVEGWLWAGPGAVTLRASAIA